MLPASSPPSPKPAKPYRLPICPAHRRRQRAWPRKLEPFRGGEAALIWEAHSTRLTECLRRRGARRRIQTAEKTASARCRMRSSTTCCRSCRRRDAVQTCVLARRWRDLWKSAMGLRIGGDGDGDDEETACVQDMREFVDHLFLLRGCAPLHMCELRFWFDDDAARRVSLWIRHAVASRVRTLLLHNILQGFEVDDLPLVSKHLKRLELVHIVLTNRFCDFSGCSVLEHVKIEESNVSGAKITSLAGSLTKLDHHPMHF